MTAHIPGHEGIGTVISPASDPLVGHRVGIRWIVYACLECEICAFREAGISQYSAVKKSNIKEGEWLILTGAGGGLGHLGLQIARNRGAKVIAIDTGPDKKSLCLSLGATAFIDYKTEDVPSRVHALTTNYGAHAALCTAGTAASYTQTLDLVRPNGTIVCVGLPGGDFTLPLSPLDFVRKCITVTGSSNGTREDTEKLMEMVAGGEVVPRIEMVEWGVEQVEEVVGRLERDEVVGRCVVRIAQ
ncbi:MAG: hypothetical protein Q9227_004130 [Pyrenula ochraceoflavens]